ncbi:MAG: hypothetical protein EA404_12650 [Spirochaetaceae bacterium]|nr:MAG: hypothetical protein EA404_12650 [Spirochaetaceae bacterium]
MRKRTRYALIMGAVLTAVAIISITLLMPWLVRSVLESRVGHYEQRWGVEAGFQRLRVVSRRTVVLEQFTVTDRHGETEIFAERVEISVRPLALLRGSAQLDNLSASGIRVVLAAEDGGRFDASASAMQLRNQTVIEVFDPQLGASAASSGTQRILLDARLVRGQLSAPLQRGQQPSLAQLTADQPQLDLSEAEPWHQLQALLRGLKGRLVPAASAAGSAVQGGGGAAHILRTLLAHLPQTVEVHEAEVTLNAGVSSLFDLQYEHCLADRMVRVKTAGRLHDAVSPSGSWNVDKSVWYNHVTVDGRSSLDALDLNVVTRALGGSRSAGFEQGLLDLTLAAHSANNPDSVALSGRMFLRDAALLLPRVADGLIEVPEISYRFRAALDGNAEVGPPRMYQPLPLEAVTVSAAPPRRGELVFDHGALRLGTLEVEFRPALRGFGKPGQLPERVELQLEIAPSAIAEIIETFPAVLLGPLAGVQAEGTLAWKLDFESPTESISRMQWRSEISLQDFTLLDIPDEINVFRLGGPFIHRISDPAVDYHRVVRVPQTRPASLRWLTDSAGLSLEQAWQVRQRAHSAPPAPTVPRSSSIHRFSSDSAERPDRSYRYVPLGSISPWLVRAVLTAEDGDFFDHRGVNWNAVRRAVEYNVEVGEYVFGASTISMQLAKNLFLGNERQFARKLQEFLLVMLMEEAAAIPKERLLEIYLNVIEFGPGIFGVYDAARHYFGVQPRDLDAAEAAWLATIVPAPKLHYHHYRNGEISDHWFARMQQLLYGMYKRERMTKEQYRHASQSRPQFAVSADR